MVLITENFLHRLLDLAAAAHAGGVDDGVFFPAALEVDVDAVARGARLIERDHALLAEYRVHQRGFADIGTAHDRDLGRMLVVRFFLFGLGRKILQRDLDHFGDIVAVRRRDRQRLAQPQFEEFRRHPGARHTLGLVHQQQYRLAGLAQLFGDDCILRRAAGASVDQEQHHIGFVHRLAALLGHLEHDAFLGDRLQSAGIHHQKGPVTDPAPPVMAVPGQPGQVCDQRVTAARKAIEQGGFAHIRTTDQNNGGQQ